MTCPEYPGINVPGDYMAQYAPDPWKYAKAVVDKAISGKYEYYFPKPTGAATSDQK